MAFVIHNTGFEVLLSSLVSVLSAQILKVLSSTIRTRTLDFRRFVETGGMPSSHTAAVVALATSVGIINGFDSVTCAIAFGTAMIVMYDAAGLRRAAGKMAGILNRMTEDFYQNHPEYFPERLKELLGHTPYEVFVGALWGSTLSVCIHALLQ
jgi:uncharacterized protein